MIQLDFDAASADAALGQTPSLVGYSQHEGAESATWDDAKLEKRDGHPVVYPGAGSHAEPVRPVAVPGARRSDRFRL